MTEATVRKPDPVDLNIISVTLPELPTRMVSRENILDTIDTMLTEVSLVVLEGEEGIGKTTILNEYARSHGDRAISLFLETASYLSSDAELLLSEVGQQVRWLLYEDDVPPVLSSVSV